MFKTYRTEVPTTELFMGVVIGRVPCRKHGRAEGEPCGTLGPHRVICNDRARKAGFNHKISEKSLRMTRPKKSR
jgi:hypothetical protein